MNPLRVLLPVILLPYLATGFCHAQTKEGDGGTPEGLSKSDWQSIRAAYEAGRHAFMPVEGDDGHGHWQALNPGQQWTTRFDGRGFLATPRGGGWAWGLELLSYGIGAHQIAVEGKTPAVSADGQRLNYDWDTAVREWWVNDTRGLEHGYVVSERPATNPNTPLSLLLSTRGSLKPKIAADALGIDFKDAAGTTVLTYTGLKAWDADGVMLPSRFEAAGEGVVRLVVEEGKARYPVTIDPLAQNAYLKAGNNGPPSNDQFGIAVAVDGDTVVVGALNEDGSTTGVNGAPNDLAANSGAAYVFVRNGSTWSQQAYLKAHQVTAGDAFGTSVAVSGNTVVVGATSEDSGTTGIDSTPNEAASGAGAAYVFVRNGTTWSQQAYLKAHQVTNSDGFGSAVAVNGDTVVVGATSEDGSATGVDGAPDEAATGSGAAYVFVRSGTTWSQQAYLKAHQVSSGDQFGRSLGVSGETVVVGANGEDGSATGVNSTPDELAFDAGAAYVFVRSGSVWSQEAYLKADEVTSSDQFGTAVAVDGNTLVVGSEGEDGSATGVNGTPDDLVIDAGAAYVFVRSGSVWSQQAYLKADGVTSSDGFGRSVGVSGDTVVVGAHNEDSSTTGVGSTPDEGTLNSGAAYVFARTGTTWTQQAYLKANQVTSSDQFGRSVAVSGNTVVVGVTNEDSDATGVNGMPNEASANSGAGYVFVRNGTTWATQAYLKASNTPSGSGSGDAFGFSVSVSGSTAVIGAYLEDGSATGVNGAPDEATPDAGAAYVFVRNGGTWSQQAYLKAHQVSSSDQFGFSVAVDGDTVVVGANFEDGGATGVNGTPDETTSAAGAAYVFVRNGTTWTQQAYLKAPQVTAGDRIGNSVAVDGDIVVVGAREEDGSATGVNGTPDDALADAGAAYVFVRNGTTWTQEAYLKAHQVNSEDRFGQSVSVSGDTVVVGSSREDSSSTGVGSAPDEGSTDAGAAYVFVRNGATWSQQAYVKAHQVNAGDNFGNSVGLSGDTLVVGAVSEDGSATGVDGPTDELVDAAGAAYVFVRNGSNWSQQAYLKAHQVSGSDQFGYAVAVSGDTVVVGATAEDGSATGINGIPNEAVAGAGAAYVFSRSGVTWSQQSYLKASQVSMGDFFGISVAVSGTTVVVGAYNEDSGATGSNGTPDEISPDSGAAYLFLVPETDIELTGQGRVIPNGDVTPSDEDDTDFGSSSITEGQVVRTFAILNAGTAPLTLTGSAPDYVSLSGPGAGSFSVSTQPSSSTIAVNGSPLIFAITFAPTTLGLQSATVTIGSDDTDENPHTFAIHGEGASFPFTFMAANDVVVTSNGYTAGGTATISLGFSLPAGTDLMIVNNTGPDPIVGTFANLVQGEIVTLNFAGQDHLFRVNYSGGTGNDLVLEWTTPGRLEWLVPKRFPSTEIEKSRTQAFGLTNRGGMPASSIQVLLSGSGEREFKVMSPAPTTMDPAASAEVSVRFKPRRPGTRRVNMTVVSDGPPATVVLSGKGKAKRKSDR